MCSNDTTLACINDGDCMSPGTCTAIGSGSARQPNQCVGADPAACEPIGGDRGECNNKSEFFCESLVRANGRGFLACSTWEEGWRFLHEVPHASGQNYMIGGPDGQIACLECSARSVVVDRTTAGPYLIHTNTAWSNPDLVVGHEVAGTDTSVARAAGISVRS